MEDRDIAIQATISTLKASIGSIPIVGGALNEYLFEIRGRIKQNRINKFVEAFAEYLSEHKPVQLHIQQIEKEEFGDFFEEVIIKASKTSSEKKKDAFKKLLASQILKPLSFDYAALQLDTISSLHEEQLPILLNLYHESYSTVIDDQAKLSQKKKQLKELRSKGSQLFTNSSYGEDSNNDPLVKNAYREISNLEREIDLLESRVNNRSAGVQPSKSEITNYYNPVLLQDLCNKGLAIDISFKYQAEPFQFVKITRLGLDIIKSLM